MTTADLLLRALHDTADPPLRPLPDRVGRLLQDLGAPPRLAAHLRAVHDVAYQLVEWVAQRYPALRFDRDAVLFGAATHVWDFPGGHVEPGERPEVALRREVAEELGAELEGVDGGPVLHRVVPQAGLDLTVSLVALTGDRVEPAARRA